MVLGAIATAVVLAVVVTTKFPGGAWLVVVAPLLVSFVAIRRHYEYVAERLSIQGSPVPQTQKKSLLTQR